MTWGHTASGSGFDWYRRVEGPGALPAGEAVPEEIEVTRVASGLVDHVDEDPPEVDRADPERGNRCDVVERLTAGER